MSLGTASSASLQSAWGAGFALQVNTLWKFHAVMWCVRSMRSLTVMPSTRQPTTAARYHAVERRPAALVCSTQTWMQLWDTYVLLAVIFCWIRYEIREKMGRFLCSSLQPYMIKRGRNACLLRETVRKCFFWTSFIAVCHESHWIMPQPG